MPGQDSNEIVVAAGGSLSFAPVGTPLPTNLTTALNAAFKDVGYIDEDGATFTAGVDVEDIMSWQKATPTRRLVTARTLAAQANLQQWNEDNFALAFGGGDWTEPTAGVHRYDPPADQDPLEEHAVVLAWQDGDRSSRLVISRATVNEEVETQFVRNGASVLPITFQALTPDDADAAWYYLTDDHQFSAAS